MSPQRIKPTSVALLLLGLLASNCHPAAAVSAPAPLAAKPPPPTAAPDTFADPPPRGITAEVKFPKIEHRKLENGLQVRAVRHGRFPIVELRLLIQSGIASDAGQPGLASLAGELLKVGGAGTYSSQALVERAEALGSDLSVTTSRDKTLISMAVTRHNLEPALDLLAAVATAPRFAPSEFKKLKEREIERLKSSARASGGWAANMLLYRELFQLPSGSHAYSRYDANAEGMKTLSLSDCKRWYKSNVTPGNSVLVAAGDIDADELVRLSEKLFKGWKGAAPVVPDFTRPNLPEKVSVWIANRPGAAQSDILLATLGPERNADHWAAAALADQILGGGVSGRLFLDVREQRSLAYSTYSDLSELAHGPVPILLSAGTQTGKTPQAVAALLEHFTKMGQTPPTAAEMQTSSQYLSDSFLIQLETLGTVAELTSHLAVLGLSDDYFDRYREQVRSLDAATVQQVAARYFVSGRAIVVVAGDAERIAKPLSRFGQVNVVDPEKGFITQVIVPHDPNVTLDVPK